MDPPLRDATLLKQQSLIDGTWTVAKARLTVTMSPSRR